MQWFFWWNVILVSFDRSKGSSTSDFPFETCVNTLDQNIAVVDIADVLDCSDLWIEYKALLIELRTLSDSSPSDCSVQMLRQHTRLRWNFTVSTQGQNRWYGSSRCHVSHDLQNEYLLQQKRPIFYQKRSESLISYGQHTRSEWLIWLFQMSCVSRSTEWVLVTAKETYILSKEVRIVDVAVCVENSDLWIEYSALVIRRCVYACDVSSFDRI